MRRSALLPSVLFAVTALGVLLIFAIVGQNVRQIRALRDDSSAVAHTLEVQQQLDAVLLSVIEAERNQNAYLLTDVEAYLTEYYAMLDRTRQTMDRLESLTDDNPGQIERMRRLREAKDRKFAQLEDGIKTAQSRGRDAAASVMSDVSRPILREIRLIADEIAAEEARLLAARRERAGDAYQSAIRGRVGSGILTALLLSSLAIFAASRARARERTTQIIAREREHLHVTLSSIGDAVIATDVHGRITLMNPVAAAITGWSPAEVTGRPIDEVYRIVDERTHAPADNPLKRLLTGGNVEGLANHAILISRNGSERPVDEKGAPIRAGDGSIRGAVLVFRDVTDRRAQEQALRDSEQRYRDAARREALARKEAETANRLKDEFLAVLSHELRTPLNAVVGWAQILQANAPTDGTLGRGLASIRRNADAQQRLVEDLLDVSRIVTGKFPLDRRPLDLRVPVTAAIDAVRPSAAAKSLSLQIDINGPVVVSGDADRMQQVAANLLSNAVKFTPASGRINVSLKDLNGQAVLMIKDNGQGLAPELLPFIFDRFRQGDASTTRTHGGLGLGLAIAKHIVDAHGGIIEAHSDGEGLGALFTVRLATTVDREMPQVPVVSEEPS
jgi:PAS domain S-box-containing protein